MFVIIPAAQARAVISTNEHEPQVAHTDASDIGLAVGEWPDFLTVMNDEEQGNLFQRGDSIRDLDRTFRGYRYYSTPGNGLTLEVWND